VNADLRLFISSYSLSFEEFGRAYCERYASDIAQVMLDALTRKAGTIYIFGNGGCHAIARCFRHSLLARPGFNHSRSRIVASVDPDSYSLMSSTPGPVYYDMLRLDETGADDLVILLSGSGDSDNLVQVAKAAAFRGIPLIALVGTVECALKAVVPVENFFPVGIRDQQLGEDIIQYLCSLVGVGRIPPAAMANEFSRQGARISNLSGEFVLRIAESVQRSFVNRERVRILGLGHPAMAACAEHTAHNLNWDAFYQVKSEPDVTIISSPSACDYSGISNDRRREYFRHFSKIYGSGDRSTTLIFAGAGSDSRIKELGIGVGGTLMETFVLCGSSPPQGLPKENIHCSHLGDPFDHASLAQCTGHIVGRTLRLKLRQAQETTGLTTPSGGPIHEYLTECDLAQRRLLNEP
jgi:phosphoheptose isomerase